MHARGASAVARPPPAGRAGVARAARDAAASRARADADAAAAAAAARECNSNEAHQRRKQKGRRAAPLADGVVNR